MESTFQKITAKIIRRAKSLKIRIYKNYNADLWLLRYNYISQKDNNRFISRSISEKSFRIFERNSQRLQKLGAKRISENPGFDTKWYSIFDTIMYLLVNRK